MHEEPTAYRLPDPGVRALFAEDSRYQAWLDVEAALAQAQAELGIIPPHAAEEITRKARLALLDRQAIRAGLERTGHSLVPLIWELDRICDGDAGGYVHWGATTQNVTQTGQLLLTRRAHDENPCPNQRAGPAARIPAHAGQRARSRGGPSSVGDRILSTTLDRRSRL